MTGKPFNKKNVNKFAKSLYYEKDGDIYYRPMCGGALAKANGEFVGCILAELYEEFEGKPVARPLSDEEIENIAINNFRHYVNEVRVPELKVAIFRLGNKYSSYINEYTISAMLAQRAVVNTNVGTRTNLMCTLQTLPMINDTEGETEEARIKRAKNVQAELFRIANDFLA